MNKMSLLIVIVVLMIISCPSYNSSIQRADRKKTSQKKTKDQIDAEIKAIKPLQLAYLFYPESYFIKKSVPKKTALQPTAPRINQENFKVVADWMVEGVRWIKVKNIATQREVIVKEGQTRGEIVLIERGLFYYKFKINGSIIKVVR